MTGYTLESHTPSYLPQQIRSHFPVSPFNYKLINPMMRLTFHDQITSLGLTFEHFCIEHWVFSIWVFGQHFICKPSRYVTPSVVQISFSSVSQRAVIKTLARITILCEVSTSKISDEGLAGFSSLSAVTVVTSVSHSDGQRPLFCSLACVFLHRAACFERMGRGQVRMWVIEDSEPFINNLR